MAYLCQWRQKEKFREATEEEEVQRGGGGGETRRKRGKSSRREGEKVVERPATQRRQKHCKTLQEDRQKGEFNQSGCHSSQEIQKRFSLHNLLDGKKMIIELCHCQYFHKGCSIVIALLAMVHLIAMKLGKDSGSLLKGTAHPYLTRFQKA